MFVDYDSNDISFLSPSGFVMGLGFMLDKLPIGMLNLRALHILPHISLLLTIFKFLDIANMLGLLLLQLL